MRPAPPTGLSLQDAVAAPNYITPSGYRRLVEELVFLATEERPKVVREVSDAAAEGDRSENAAYIYGKRRLREIDRRMRFLSVRLRDVQVVDARGRESDRVFFGAHVTIEDEDGEQSTYQIVGVDEVDVKAGRISWQSPVGRALLGKRLDDAISVSWHAGQREITIVEVDYDPETTESVRSLAAQVVDVPDEDAEGSGDVEPPTPVRKTPSKKAPGRSAPSHKGRAASRASKTRGRRS